MSHNIETMAYAGEVPWHGLGKRVPNDLSPQQMLEAAELDWTVETVPAYATVAGKKVAVGRSALVRSSDHSVLDIVGNDWKPVQNIDAFEFFNDFIQAGDMQMHTAGSLRDGQIVWALAKVNESFSLFKGDEVESYLLFTNPHRFGQAIDIRFTPIRVVCNNTLTLALNKHSDKVVRHRHRTTFKADEAKQMLGIAHQKLDKYKEMAKFLGSKKVKEETVMEYFKRVFPVLSTKEKSEKEVSKQAARAMEVLHTQPGAEFAKGTWWQSWNAVTYLVDHEIGKTDDNRLSSAWYGRGSALKVQALDLALELAKA